jgi:hypothetical protein
VETCNTLSFWRLPQLSHASRFILSRGLQPPESTVIKLADFKYSPLSLKELSFELIPKSQFNLAFYVLHTLFLRTEYTKAQASHKN